MHNTIDPRLQMGPVSLSVADLKRSLAYYQDHIGLQLLEASGSQASLGTPKQTLLKLIEQPGARPTRGTTGLYHFALRVPDRAALGQVIQHLIAARTPVSGTADHLVSEALYLSDPDGHGIEIYRDRPRQDWYDEQGNLQMDTLALDVEAILAESGADENNWQGLPAETDMGHIHLHVADLAAAEDFYLDLLGFGKPFDNRRIPSASFIGAGGYHHHIGLNTWAGAGAPLPPQDAARLLQYEIIFPHPESLDAVFERFRVTAYPLESQQSGWLVRDPSHNTLLLRAQEQHN